MRAGRVEIALKVVPGASKSRVVGRLGDRLKVAVAAAPQRGAANDEVCRLLAGRLGVRPGSVRIERGGATPLKTASVPLANIEEARRALEEAPPP